MTDHKRTYYQRGDDYLLEAQRVCGEDKTVQAPICLDCGAILAERLQHKPRLILSGKGARIEDADDRDMLRMLEALAEAMEARGWCTDAIWADVHRIAWWMDQRSDALVEATRDER